MATPEINYKRLASAGIGGLSAFTGAWTANQLSTVPSFFASWVGLGGVVDVSFTIGGLALGFGGYLYASKVANTWPMEKKEDNRTFVGRLFRSKDEEALYDQCRAGVLKLEQELRTDLKPDRVAQIMKDAGSCGVVPLRFIKTIAVEAFVPTSMREQPKPATKTSWWPT